MSAMRLAFLVLICWLLLNWRAHGREAITSAVTSNSPLASPLKYTRLCH